ncbi:hypothetical protein F4604DRAFT_1574409, partial [Suillus subluteus]
TSPWQLGNALRQPDPNTAIGRTILERIIPIVNILRGHLPLSMASMFLPSLLAHHKLPRDINYTNLEASDRFFDSIIFNSSSLNPVSQLISLGSLNQRYIRTPPTMGKTPHTSSCSSSSILSSTSTNSSTLCPHPTSSILIQTTYNTLDPKNRKMPTPQEREVDLVWTEEQRRYAEHAVKMDSVDELLKGLYADGIKSPSNTYVFIPNSLIRGHQLELRNNDGTLMTYICSTMLSSIRDSLLQQLLLAFEDEDLLVDKDTSQDSDNSFQAIHFSWYNRHATRGDTAPINIHPYMMERSGVQTNHSQFTPYISVETALNQDLYELVKVIFGDLFQWIQNNLQKYLPEEYELLEASARILLGNHHSPVLPFLSLVFNINVITKGHRDGKDKDFCLVLPIGVFVGGELVMMETGLMVEVLQGGFLLLILLILIYTTKDVGHL